MLPFIIIVLVALAGAFIVAAVRRRGQASDSRGKEVNGDGDVPDSDTRAHDPGQHDAGGHDGGGGDGGGGDGGGD